MRNSIVLFTFAITQIIFSQNPYPQDYFRSPLDVAHVLSGTFAELRSNHFHAGLDLKTQQREGLKVYTAAAGYVSRIKISHWGYGKALYITHPNGYTTVYAHLKSFAPEIERYVKKAQYEQETFEIELFPKYGELPVETDEVVAYSGNTGGSSGPHLHFEIRDKNERPMNPMLFGIDVKDSRPPVITGIFAYPVDPDSYANNSRERSELRLVPQANGNYLTEDIKAYGRIGFGIVTFDRQDLAANKNGVQNIQCFHNGNKTYEADFSRFSFDETKHLNRHIDYQYFRDKRSRIQKLFVQENNPLSIYKDLSNMGYLDISDSTASVYKVRVKDFRNNDTWLTINITGERNDSIPKREIPTSDHYIYADQNTNLDDGLASVFFASDTFYDDFFIDFQVHADTLFLHQPNVSAQKRFSITYDISNYKESDRDKLYIARLQGYRKRKIYSATTRKENTLITRTRTLGTYVLASDITRPRIRASNFKEGNWLSRYRYLKVKITDQDSGVRSYRATVNGKWILMEYDPKKNMLVHDFNDKVITETKNNLKVIVVDNVGNSSTFETIFYRK